MVPLEELSGLTNAELAERAVITRDVEEQAALAEHDSAVVRDALLDNPHLDETIRERLMPPENIQEPDDGSVSAVSSAVRGRMEDLGKQ